MKYRGIKKYQKTAGAPLKLAPGVTVVCLEESDTNGDWPGWVLCKVDEIQGWVPTQIISRTGKSGVVIEEYSAAEFDVNPGDIFISEKTLNGWIWCTKNGHAEEKAWAPLNCLEYDNSIEGIKMTNGCDAEFIEMCKLLDDSLDEIVGKKFQRQVYDQYNQLNDIKDAVLIYIDKSPAASGSFKRYDDATAEVKRIFVKKEYRGRGLSKLLMAELEKHAVNQGYSRLILETGDILEASMGLYKSIGFSVIENYGQYKDMKDSVCMEKNIEHHNKMK